MIFFENSRYRYGKTAFLRRHYVTDKASRSTKRPTDEQLRRLSQIFEAAQTIPWPVPTSQRTAETKIYLAFCMTVHGVDEVWATFMTQEPSIAAITFGTI